MKMSWQTESDRPICRWSEVGNSVQYNPSWAQDALGAAYSSFLPSGSDFTRVSPFGGKKWYALLRERSFQQYPCYPFTEKLSVP
jgi:hypothetical protein